MSSKVEYLNRKDKPKVYFIGKETSGPIHLGHYLCLKYLKSKMCESTTIKILLADINAQLNSKKDVSYHCVKLQEFYSKFMPGAEIYKTSDVIKDPLYWRYFLEFCKVCNFNDIYRSLPMENKTSKIEMFKLPSSNMVYSVMQCVDVEYFKAEVCVAGIDQRNIYMVGYDNYDKLKWTKPELVFFPLLTMDGVLTEDVLKKMSSSKKNIVLDHRLYQTAILQSQGTSTLLEKIITEPVLELYNLSFKEFLQQLIADLEPLKDFNW